MLSRQACVKTVAQPGQKIHRLPGHHGRHGLRTLTHYLVYQGEGFVVPVTDRDGPPQVEARQLHLHKRARLHNG